jgi:SAM-dependent methyltransferase
MQTKTPVAPGFLFLTQQVQSNRMAEKNEREYTRRRIEHWDRVNSRPGRLHGAAGFYHRMLESKASQLVRPGLRVLELGCGNGDLVAALEPSFGAGIDFSGVACNQAHQRHPELLIMRSDAHTIPLKGTFDVVILSDLINDLWDAQQVFARLSAHVHAGTRIILNVHNRLWQLPLGFAELLGLKNQTRPQNWFAPTDLRNLAALTDFQIVKFVPEILLPVWLPLLSWFSNNFLVKFWPFNIFGLTNFIVLRPLSKAGRPLEPSVSVIIPARNEAGNIASIFQRLPSLGSKMEMIFVEGHSRDETRTVIEKQIFAHPEQKAHLLAQEGSGKATAVWQGFAAAQNDILMILDSDLSVAPEDLPRFYDALLANKGELINGSRLVYPMEGRAMALANLAGNKLFSLVFSWLLEQPVKDTLCGTKVLWRTDFEALKDHWQLFGKVDPFGDFDILLGASKLNLRIIDLPVRYRERTYGSTNIQRWRHGLMLLRITLAGAWALKFNA